VWCGSDGKCSSGLGFGLDAADVDTKGWLLAAF
jgi:hypothetical protein